MADIDPDEMLTTEEFIRRWTNQEYLLLERKRAADIADDKIGNAKTFDRAMASDVLRLTSQSVMSLKADLIADGILTQARADEIFS